MHSLQKYKQSHILFNLSFFEILKKLLLKLDIMNNSKQNCLFIIVKFIKKGGKYIYYIDQLTRKKLKAMDSKLGQVLRSLKASKKDQLPQYAQHIVPFIKQQIIRLNKQINSLSEKQKSQSQSQAQENQDDKMFRKVKLAIHFDQVYRIKRFLMIYHNFRCNKLEEQFWHLAGELKPQMKNHLSEEEKVYFNQYKSLASQYMQEVGLQLAEDLDPPIDSEVQAIFLQDCGQILNDEGQVQKLQKNVLIYIKKRLIQNFIKQGKAVIMTH